LFLSTLKWQEFKMTYSLPQSDPNPEHRKQQIKAAQQKYVFDLGKFANISPNLQFPMVYEVPSEDSSLTKQDWVLDVTSVLLRIQANQSLYDSEVQRGSLCKLVWYVRLYKLIGNPDQRGFVETIYKALLSVIQAVIRLTGRTPKSEDIKYDVTHQKTAQLEQRLVSMVSDTQKQSAQVKLNRRTPRPKNKDPHNIFQTYQDLFQIIYLPHIAKYILSDREFAAQRVAGANPLVIQQIAAIPDNFPITEAQYQRAMGATDSLNHALNTGRLYMTDYRILAEIETSSFPEGEKFLCKPIGLFAMEPGDYPGRKLRPVAIQCNQIPSAQNPIFTPPALDASTSEKWGWRIAKLMLQIADGNYHELISHLGRTHLLVEPIAIATQQQLATKHPLHALLTPHFEGTLFINDAAVKGLINPQGTVDKVLAGTLVSSLRLAVKSTREFPFSFNESFLPATLQKRGVNNPQTLPDYPYRDDALLLWDAIHEWVSGYLGIFYLQDNDVINDHELQNWLAKLLSPDGGQMIDIGQITSNDPTPRIRTLDYLIEMTTHIIFTSSVQHAAVNYPQSSLMTYIPNMPLAAYRDAPQSPQNLTAEDFFNILPSLAQSEAQMNMTHLLGSIYYTTLGQYAENHFTHPRIKQHQQDFTNTLKRIELIINQRNETRATHYDILKPSKIPQSINI
jgi:arachidonate 15-lipoxygenase